MVTFSLEYVKKERNYFVKRILYSMVTVIEVVSGCGIPQPG